MTSGDGDQEAERTMGHVGRARGGAVREDFPEEEVTELSLEGLAGAHEVVQAQEVLRTQRAEQRH